MRNAFRGFERSPNAHPEVRYCRRSARSQRRSSAAISAFWAVDGAERPSAWLGLLLAAGGLGATLGPYAAGRIRTSTTEGTAARFIRATFGMRALLLGALVAAAFALPTGPARILVVAVALFALSGLTVATVVAQATARQLGFGGAALAQAVGWGHTGSAAGSLLGAWLGIWLHVASTPAAGLAVAAVVAATGLVTIRARPS